MEKDKLFLGNKTWRGFLAVYIKLALKSSKLNELDFPSMHVPNHFIISSTSQSISSSLPFFNKLLLLEKECATAVPQYISIFPITI